jgi:hypothetical protein
MCISATTFLLVACDDQLMQRNQPTVGTKTIGRNPGMPGGFQENPGESYPFPNVSHAVHIPGYAPFAYEKCLTWRIGWPWYDSDYDYNLIPTVLSVTNGELNSFNLLNNTDPQNTFNSTMSLFYSNKVESASMMWDELDYTFSTPGYQSMDPVQFIKGNVTPDVVQYWVEERPKLFIENYPEGLTSSEVNYAEGDFIHFWLTGSNQYGGIRIVSMQPRIIEVYLATPNL